MKVAVIGASGKAGSRIAAELSRRGHSVTGIARNSGQIPALPGVVAEAGDVADGAALSRLLAGHDAVVSAVHFTACEPDALIAAVCGSGVRRYLVVGGAGSLEVAPGLKLIDTPEFPPAWKTGAAAGGHFLDRLRLASDLEWTFFSPAAMFSPGERKGKFRLGLDALITGPDGSAISMEDYAIAAVDELETPRHVRQRFTIGY